MASTPVAEPQLRAAVERADCGRETVRFMWLLPAAWPASQLILLLVGALPDALEHCWCVSGAELVRIGCIRCVRAMLTAADFIAVDMLLERLDDFDMRLHHREARFSCTADTVSRTFQISRRAMGSDVANRVGKTAAAAKRSSMCSRQQHQAAANWAAG